MKKVRQVSLLAPSVVVCLVVAFLHGPTRAGGPATAGGTISAAAQAVIDAAPADAVEMFAKFARDARETERRLGDEARSIFENENRSAADEDRLAILIRLLSTIGRSDSADLFAEHLLFRYKNGVRRNLREEPAEFEYPCFEALTYLRGLAPPALVTVIASTDDKALQDQCAHAIEFVGFDLIDLQRPRETAPGSGRLFARIYLRTVAASTTDEARARRVIATAKRLEKVHANDAHVDK